MLARFKSAYINLGIHRQMLLLISALMLGSFASYSLVLNMVYNTYDNQLYEKTSELLNMSSFEIENQLKDIDNLSFRVVTDEQLQRYLFQLRQQTSIYEKNVIRKKITNRLAAFAGSEKFVYSMLAIDREGELMFAGNREGIPAKLRPELVRLAQQHNGSNAWYAGDQGELIAVRQFKQFSGSTFTLHNLGTIMIRVRIDRIVQEQVESSSGSQLIISDGSKILYPNKLPLSREQIDEGRGGSKPYGVITGKQESYFSARIQSPYTGWTYLHITPFDSEFQRVIWIKQLVTFVFIAIFLLALLLGTKLSRSITHPMERLLQNMRTVETGNLDQLGELPADPAIMRAQNEVGLLHRTFNRMLRRIRELIDENYAKQLLIRETELKALQAQIDPHFLYNTLESINWMAKMNKQPEISRMVEALGFLLRSSVNMTEKVIRLDDELAIVRSYVTIQRMRFEERLDFAIDVPPELGDTLIPKLTLQPLVENAIHYALEPNIEVCHIHIKAWAQQGTVYIVVEDDGPGMTAEFLERLHQGQVQTRGKGIGLSNIIERIRLTFGADYGLDIESEPDVRTAFQIRIPDEKGEDGDVQSVVSR
ncbi:sensor histidine kinase [Paenibacillus campi]|uniref:sensor histidine kinase n=1 Tax=Paenibacillus campi TaxID=3106031 RepID=UPI002AFF4159|nr:sensor histidine kinase [Paenibacillus sp. SGZ-1014]